LHLQLLSGKVVCMNEKLDDLHLAAWRNFITAHALLIDLIDKELMAAGCVPLHWYDVLIELAEAPERRLRMSDLARKVVLSRSGLTRLVDKLEGAGMLLREATPGDGRGAFAVLTDDGMAALRKAWPVYAQGIKRHFAQHLSDEEARIYQESLGRMLR
jgi:DNA-binding MarR family transcriptional regulator